MNELALFAGAGGGILGGKLLGWTTVCAVEWEAYPASVLIARQNEGVLPPFPIWDDVRTFDGRPWRGRVDVVSGGFPCQDISAAGKGAGIDGERSGMWAHMARIVREVGPRFVFVENSPMLTSRGLGRVLGDLAAMGYDARWGVLGAVDAGAPHKRDRIWIVAHSDLHEHRTNGRKEAEQGSISSEHRPERCAWGIGGTSSDSEILADAQGGESRKQAKRHGRESLGGRGGNSGEIANTRAIAVADAEKQFARGLPIGTSSEYPRLGVSGENVADALRYGPQGQREDGNTEGSAGLCSGKGGNQVEHLRNAASEGLPLGIDGPLGQSGPISESERSDWWATEPDVGRVAHGVAARVDRLKAIGNGQVPAVAALAWRILTQ